MGDSGPFSVGEKVLVPHTDKFYEAKVQKAQRREDGLWYYFLHYLGKRQQQQQQLLPCSVCPSAWSSRQHFVCACHAGWNKKWDEWVEETGLKRPGEAVVSAPPGAAAAGGGPSQAGGPAGLGAGAAPLQFGAVSGAAAGSAFGAAKPKMKQRRGTSGETGGVLGSGGGAGTHIPLLCAVSTYYVQAAGCVCSRSSSIVCAWTAQQCDSCRSRASALLRAVCVQALIQARSSCRLSCLLCCRSSCWISMMQYTMKESCCSCRGDQMSCRQVAVGALSVGGTETSTADVSASECGKGWQLGVWDTLGTGRVQGGGQAITSEPSGIVEFSDNAGRC